MIDLHTHSTYSDGTYTPGELIDEAERKGLTAVALCDHNTVTGLPEFIAAAVGKNVEAVPGVEFSTEYNGHELHLLALYVQPEHYAGVSRLVEEVHRKKENSNMQLVEKLVGCGYQISYAEIKAKTSASYLNRAHIAAELTEKGYTKSIADAFATLLHPKNGLYVAPERLQTLQMIEKIKAMDALAILAHPLINLSVDELYAFLIPAKKRGLDGIEAYYSLYTTEQTETAERIAAEFRLKVSGGSDFHGANKPDILLGSGRGNLLIDEAILKSLKS